MLNTNQENPIYMKAKVIFLILVFSFSFFPLPTAYAQVGAPDVNLTCSSADGSGSVEIEVYPGASLTGTATCIASNPNSYQEKIEIQVQADGLVVAHPGSLTLGPNAEEEFVVTIRADEQMSVQSRNLVVTATVTEVMGLPPPNIAEKQVNMIVDIRQFSGVQVEAVDPLVILGSKIDYYLEYKVYNLGNGADRFMLEMKETDREDLEAAGFTMVLPITKVDIDSMVAPAKVRLQIRTPSDYQDWPINSDGLYEMSFTLEFMATSEFSCNSEPSGCNTESVTTTITIVQEATGADKIFTGNSNTSQLLIYGGAVTGIILVILLFVVLIKSNKTRTSN